MPSSILTYFPGEPRPQQVEALLKIEKEWDNADIFILQLPVSTGKSRIAVTVARWAFKEKHVRSNILVPTNVLLDQYTSEFTKLHYIQRKDLYKCKNTPDAEPLETSNCDYSSRMRMEKGDKKPQYCPNCCYLQAVKRAHGSPYMVANYWSYMALKLYKPLAIFDECHNLAGVIRGLEGKTLWRKDYKYPINVTTYQTLLDWVTKNPETKTSPKLKLLKEELETGRHRYLIEKGFDLYRGEEQECLKMLPLDISNAKPVLWPSGKVNKMVLMSATFSEVDLDILGLQKRRVCIISTGSPIPPERRPVVFQPIVNSSHAYQATAAVRLAKFLKELADAKPGQKGFVHCTYALSSKIFDLLHNDSRFIFHDSSNKMEQYTLWRSQASGIFIGCGLSEGIDLAGQEYGWQVLAKAQYANLSEPAIKYQAEEKPKDYVWNALRECAQACGRICRTPTDYGETYLLDSTFKKLFTQSKHYGIVPLWLDEQLTNPEDLYATSI